MPQDPKQVSSTTGAGLGGGGDNGGGDGGIRGSGGRGGDGGDGGDTGGGGAQTGGPKKKSALFAGEQSSGLSAKTLGRERERVKAGKHIHTIVHFNSCIVTSF